MKEGKIPVNVRRRILEKNITKRSLSNSPVLTIHSVPVKRMEDVLCAMHRAANHAYAGGAKEAVLACSWVLPSGMEERDAADLFRMEKDCAELWVNADISGGHTLFLNGIDRPIFTVSASGSGKKQYGGIRPGDDLVAVGYLGLEGTVLLLEEYKEELSRRYTGSFLDRMWDLRKELSVKKAAEICVEYGVSELRPCGEGGILGALWEIGTPWAGRGKRYGLEAELKDFPIRQETVELSEYLSINPYELESTGLLLAACENGEGLTSKLRETGLNAVCIGQFHEGADRIIRNQDEIRYVDRPKQSALYSELYYSE